jgi:hypothetical protein
MTGAPYGRRSFSRCSLSIVLSGARRPLRGHFLVELGAIRRAPRARYLHCGRCRLRFFPARQPKTAHVAAMKADFLVFAKLSRTRAGSQHACNTPEIAHHSCRAGAHGRWIVVAWPSICRLTVLCHVHEQGKDPESAQGRPVPLARCRRPVSRYHHSRPYREAQRRQRWQHQARCRKNFKLQARPFGLPAAQMTSANLDRK